MAVRLAYFVHDVADAAVKRRVEMLQTEGVEVIVVGFRRGASIVSSVSGAPVFDLGATSDGRFAQRIWAILQSLMRFRPIRDAVADADVFMARNLETLPIALRARNGRRLVYECLDIHRLLLGSGTFARLVQRAEQLALRQVSLIVTSSPRFISDYFRSRRGIDSPILLAENKLPSNLAIGSDRPISTLSAPPWRIGWFGMLRCRRSLKILSALARASAGRIEILIAGIPSEAEFHNFQEMVADLPGVSFAGRYSPADLKSLYGQVHFAWAIDFFEEGLNSKWLLPNRLYEALGYGAIPIALKSVETGAWLERNGVGLLIDQPDDLVRELDSLDDGRFGAMKRAVVALPRASIEMTVEESASIVATILGRPLRSGAL